MVWHKFYQWVPLVLALTAVTFSLPRFIWKRSENGLMTFLCKDLKFATCNFEKEKQNVLRLLFLFETYRYGLESCSK